MKKKLLSFILPQTLETVNSKYNGIITARMFMGRVSIEAGGLMQSGIFLKETWERCFNKYKIPASPAGRQDTKYDIQKILVLGLGGGSVVHVCNKFFPKAQVTAVDIDRNMVFLGKKYLNLKKAKRLRIVISDAITFLNKERNKKNKYDLIIVDLYQGYNIPKKFQTTSFIQKLNQICSIKGVVIFNLLKLQSKNPEARSFLDKVEKVFHYRYTLNVFANTFVFVKT